MNVEIFDLETDGFVKDMTVIWSCGIANAKDGIVQTYTDYDDSYPSLAEGLERLRKADRVVAHNLIGFDFPALEKIHPNTLRFDQLWDSFIVSQMLDSDRRSHAIKSYGNEYGSPKGSFTNFTMEPVEGQTRAETFKEMFKYMEQDVLINVRIYNDLQRKLKADLLHNKIDWRPAMDMEFKFNWCMALQNSHGFRLDMDKARNLEGILREEQILLERDLQTTFPDAIVPAKGSWAVAERRWANIETTTPKVGNKSRGIVKGAPYTKVNVQPFNAGSRNQIIHRLTSKYPKWKPSKFTNSGLVQIDEKVLASLRAPEAKHLGRYFRVTKQLSQLADGKSAWLKLEVDGRIHGRVNSCGTRTARCAHHSPNVAQVEKRDLRMREIWVPDVGQVQVGCDASGLELRMLAHYLAIWDGGSYAEAVIHGSNADGTDAHSRTQKLAGLQNRNSAKSLIYAFLYGAGNQKLAEVHALDAIDAGLKPMAINHPNGKKIRDKLMRGITGLENIIQVSQHRDKTQGWLKCLDGRKIRTNGQHSALNTLLQSAGAVVMKLALVEFHFDIMPKLGLIDANNRPIHFNYLVNCHDEQGFTCEPEYAEVVGQAFADAIKQAGEKLNLRCPLEGEYMVGDSWATTH